MQTFLPYPCFIESAKCLDFRRLGKQRVESKQLLNALEIRKSGIAKGGWVNHPATVMWEGYEDALKHYMNIMIIEWRLRKYKNTMQFASVQTHKRNKLIYEAKEYEKVFELVKNDPCPNCPHSSGIYCKDGWYGFENSQQTINMPPFIGNVDFHSSHRSNLLRKDFKYYSQFGWEEPINLPYIWGNKLFD